ncbi:hypothetical protein F4802DRAFT_504294 [Xylaria palmicola]|nr:hypothetical protein F4802DRAFT_504294 [Xylaria palmicola]
MGLPLFIPPVESDVPAKTAAKCPVDPSHTRSPIRRGERRRQLNETRERRLRMLDAIQVGDYTPRHLPSALPSMVPSRSATRPADAHALSGRQSPRPEDARFADRAARREQQLQRQYGRVTSELSRVLTIDAINDQLTPILTRGVQIPTEWPSPPLNVFPDPTPPLNRAAPSRRLARRGERDRDDEEFRYHRRRRLIEQLTQPASTTAAAAHRHAQRVRYFDGLGDRDRSLSPEGDGVWDTLQSTLTPDPQPPSVSTSFASTVTAATPPTNGVNSINTSVTTPDEEPELPFDFGNSRSDCEDDMEEQTLLGPSGQHTPNGRRSYADVLTGMQMRHSSESADTNDPDREWLSGMHRIVRGLASRSDLIPDEWWAQAGLSRSMSWEDSN